MRVSGVDMLQLLLPALYTLLIGRVSVYQNTESGDRNYPDISLYNSANPSSSPQVLDLVYSGVYKRVQLAGNDGQTGTYRRSSGTIKS